MSGIVALIGYLLLIPSIIGIAFSVLMLFVSGGATSQTMDMVKAETRQKLASASVPTTTIEHVLNSQPLSAVEQQGLTPEQIRAVDDAKLSMSAGMAGAGLGGFFAGGEIAFKCEFICQMHPDSLCAFFDVSLQKAFSQRFAGSDKHNEMLTLLEKEMHIESDGFVRLKAVKRGFKIVANLLRFEATHERCAFFERGDPADRVARGT